MLFKSPHANMTFNIRPEVRRYHPVTGVEIGRTPAVRCEFGQLGDEIQITDPETGDEITVANISGHFFDTDEAAERLGWDKDVKETVEAVLIGKCSEVPMFIQRVEATPVLQVAPWLTYDQTEPEKIAEMAAALGVVPQALLYERQNEQRPVVLDDLESGLATLPPEEQRGADEHIAYQGDSLEVAKAGPEAPVRVALPPRRTEGGITTV